MLAPLAIVLGSALFVPAPARPAMALGSALTPAPARHRRPRVTYEDPRDHRPSSAYAAMGKAACMKELAARKIPFSKVEKAPGVTSPVRLTGPVAGVTYRSEAPDLERAQSPAEVRRKFTTSSCLKSDNRL